MTSLYDDCLVQLGKQARILSEEETVKLFDVLQDCMPFTSYGRIDWESVKLKERFSKEITITFPETRVFVMWDNAIFPAIESSLSKILDALETVQRVSFDTWIFLPGEFVIEFYHEGEINIGYIK